MSMKTETIIQAESMPIGTGTDHEQNHEIQSVLSQVELKIHDLQIMLNKVEAVIRLRTTRLQCQSSIEHHVQSSAAKTNEQLEQIEMEIKSKLIIHHQEKAHLKQLLLHSAGDAPDGNVQLIPGKRARIVSNANPSTENVHKWNKYLV